MIAADVYERASRIRLVIFDVDGVLTDGGLLFDEQGREFKVFHSRDGHGMKMLQRTGVDIAVISGRKAESVAERMSRLGVGHVFQGHEDKLPVFLDLLSQLSLSADQAAYVGDDVLDLPVMGRVGLAVAVGDAHPLVTQYAHWQTPSAGGRGAAREVCDLIMQAQGTLEGQIGAYLKHVD